MITAPEGSTGQTDKEQARFLGMALRSLIETVACQHLISRRGYLADPAQLRQAYRDSEMLARKLQAMRRAIAPARGRVREDSVVYDEDSLLLQVISEGLSVAGWVALWFPLELLSFTVWQHRLDKRIYTMLASMELEIQFGD